MKQEESTAHWTRNLLAVGLIVFASFACVRAQANGTVIPSVCFEAKPETFTRTATANFNFISSIRLNQVVPDGFYSLVINPSGMTEERFAFGRTIFDGTILIGGPGLPSQTFQFNHSAGETILLIAEGDAVYGYNNTSSAAVTIQRGVTTRNYFAPGTSAYAQQPFVFQPGVHENVITLKVLAAVPYTWYLDNGQATSTANAAQGCATITYQGRLSDAGGVANGQYDLQFQAFDSLTGGASQSELIKLEDVQVTNGVFTVPLNVGSTLTNNLKARFLQIRVRPGAGTGNDPFTVLMPRQPLTQVPYAVNAIIAQTASSVSGAVRLLLTTNAPPATECDTAAEHGQMKVDAVNNRLYICTTTGWKSTVLQ